MSDIQRDREERQHVIEVLKSWDGYFIGYTSDEVQEALRYAIASIKTDLRYDLLYEETSEQADKPTTKNDLEVDVSDNNVGNIDCISREQAKAAIRNRFKDLPSRVEINTILNELPPVTPQEPILDRVSSELESKLDNINRLYNQDNQYDDGAIDSLQYALDIIDKYKEESENKG